MKVQYSWPLEVSGVLPAGTEIQWHWEVENSSGQVLVTEPQQKRVENSNYTWQSTSKIL